MYTKTADCLDIGNRRKVSEDQKSLPAIQFKTTTAQASGEVMILAMNFSSPTVRLALEAFYLASSGSMTGDELEYLVTKTLPQCAQNEDSLVRVLRTIRQMRDDEYNGEISLTITSSALEGILDVLKSEGCLSFSCGLQIGNATEVNSFEEIDEEFLKKLYKGDWEEAKANVSTNKEFIGYHGRYMYPEDCFIGRGNLYLSYIDSLTGGAYDTYKTLKEAYRVDEHFRENPDFFSDTHCQCGGELVVRTQNGEYTLMSCINTYCYEKMAYSLADLSRAMGIDGLGAITFMNLTKGIALRNLREVGNVNVGYRDLLKEENHIYFGDSTGDRFVELLDRIANYTGTIKDLIAMMGLPYVSSEASKILTSSLLRNSQLTPMQLQEACKREGKYDLKFIINLWMYLDSIRYVALDLAKSVNLEVVDEYVIYITKGVRLQLDDGTVMPYTKKQFEELVNQVLANSGVNDMRLKINGSLTHKCQALIADQGRDTGSCRTAENYGIPIMTSREFLGRLGGGSGG